MTTVTVMSFVTVYLYVYTCSIEVAALHRFEVNIFPSYIIHVFICPFTPKVSNSRQRTMMNGLLHSTVNQLHSLPVTTVYNLSVLYLCG